MRTIWIAVALTIASLGCSGESPSSPQGYWEGSGRAREVLMDDDFRHLWESAEYELWFVIDPSGDVVGEITLDYDAQLTVENLPAVTVPAPGGSVGFNPSVGGKLTDLDPRRVFPLTGQMTDGILTLEVATPADERESLEFTVRSSVGVSAGIGGAEVSGANYRDQAIKVPMVPFSPFTGRAEVSRRAGGVFGAHFEDKGDKYAIEWSARWVRGQK